MLNRISLRCVASVAVVCLFLPAFAEGAAKTPLLNRRVSISTESSSVTQYLLTLFNKAGIHGGVAIVNEQCQEAVEQFPEFEGDLRGALEKLASTGHDLHWLEVGDSLVVHNTPSPPPILMVVVRQFQFSRKEALTKSSSNLLDAPEVSAKVQSLHLVERGPELGFAQLQQPTTPQDIVTLTNTTVIDALNNMAGNHAVWLYKESRCERNIMSLNWPVR
jgi:hypothetical protein